MAAPVFIDGFESGDLFTFYEADPANPPGGAVAAKHKDDVPDDWNGTSFTDPSYGNYVLFMEYPGSKLLVPLTPFIGTTENEIYIKFRVQMSHNNNGEGSLVRLRNPNNTTICTFGLSNTYPAIYKSTPHSGNKIQQHAVPLSLDTWYCFEIYLEIPPYGSSTGSYEVKKNGAQILKGNNVNLNGASAGDPYLNDLFLWCAGSSSSATSAFDDFHISTTEWPGTGYIQGAMPNAVGLPNWNWVNSSGEGTSWEALNDRPIDDTDYIYTAGVDVLHTSNLENITVGSPVICVQSQYRIRKEGLPNCNYVEPFLRQGANNAMSGENKEPPMGVFEDVTQMYLTRPVAIGGGSWSPAMIGTLEIGLKSKE